MTGATRLAQLLTGAPGDGAEGERIVAKVRVWLGLRDRLGGPEATHGMPGGGAYAKGDHIDAKGGHLAGVAIYASMDPLRSVVLSEVVETEPEWLRQALTQAGVKLLLADPLMAYLDGKVNSWSDQDVRAALASGPRPAVELQREARVLGISETTLKRTRKKLGIRTVREGFGGNGQWLWALPDASETSI